MTVILLLTTIVCNSEATVWDCPECGRTGNTGNYCGSCAHPAPWVQTEDDNSTSTLDFRTVGNIVLFGHYEQDNDISNGTEEIEWIVLDYDKGNNRALLLSKYGLEAVPYNREFTAITWEQCTLRAWLNSEFLSNAFSAKEQSAILVTNVDNSSGQGFWSTYGGDNTQDRIFLLSYAEANKYFGVQYCSVSGSRQNTTARVTPTAYAIAQEAWTLASVQTADGEPAGVWWLRSPGNYREVAAGVDTDGSLNYFSVDYVKHVVRPAFWLNLEFDIF